MEETSRLDAVKSCLDCGTVVDRRFCPQCGLKVGPRQRPFWSMLAEFFAESFALDGRFFRSLAPLLFKPGTLSREYNAGRRARYVSPFRLYLLSAFLLFFSFTVEAWIAGVSVESGAATDSRGETNSVAPDVRPAPSVPAPRIEPIPPKVQLRGIEDLPMDRPIFRRLRERLEAANRDREEWKDIFAAWLGTLPTTLFFLLPIFAFLTWIALFRTPTYFAEAFVFSLHSYSFTYLFLLVEGVTPDFPGKILCYLVLPLYFIVALARAFEIKWYSAVLRSLALGVIFAPILLLAGFLALAYAAATS
jgi:hypothetical protein